jgi:uncharacterized protein YjiS (DUF1127 family)
MTYSLPSATRDDSLSGPAHQLAVRTIAKIAEWRRRRSLRNSLYSLSADKLRDLGLTPGDLDEVLSMTLTKDASKILREAAAKRSGNW